MPKRIDAIVPVSGQADPAGTESVRARVYHGLWDFNSKTLYCKTRKALWAGGVRNSENTELITGWFGGHNNAYWNQVYYDHRLYEWMLGE
jgi:hypothetical protein